MSYNVACNETALRLSLSSRASFMDEANRPGMGIAELLGATWRLWRSHARLFVLLMGIPIAVLLVMALIMNYVVLPHPQGTPLVEVWRGTSFLQKVAVFVLFLANLAVQYRALAASVFATQEIRSGHSVGVCKLLEQFGANNCGF